MAGRLADFGALWPAERRLAAWIRAGNREECVISPGLPPEDAPREHRLRASFLRALALGGFEDCLVSEKGLRVVGAHVEGDGPEAAETRGLDLGGCNLGADLALIACRFPDPVLLRGAALRSLFLNGSALMAGFGADRLDAQGGVFLRGVVAEGAVRLLGAKLGGNLSATDTRFTGREGEVAFSADRLEAKGGVFLHGVAAEGEVRLLGAKLGGNLSATDARFTGREGEVAFSADRLEAKGGVFLRGVAAEGEVRLPGAKLGGDLSLHGATLTPGKDGRALSLDGAHVSGALFLRAGAKLLGTLGLSAAEIGTIVDAEASWPRRLILDRCRYGGFAGGAPVGAAARIRWLSLQDGAYADGDFRPQPWEQCARALREAGHSAAAREVLVEKEKRQRRARREELRRAYLFEDAYWHAIWDTVLGATIRYGRQPLLAFAWLAGFLALGTGVFATAESFGALKPNLPQIQRAEEWVGCDENGALRGDFPTQYGCYLDRPQARSYPRFNAFVYSADTLFPVVGLEMQSYWLPDERIPVGKFARYYLWLHIAMGWALTLLAVAGFSGLVKQDST